MIRATSRSLAALPLVFLALACGEDKPAPAPSPEPTAAPTAQVQPTSAPTARARLKPKSKPTATAAAPTAMASAAAVAPTAEAAPPAPEPTVDCDALLLPEDIQKACGAAAALDTGAQAGAAAPAGEAGDIGATERSCSRRFSSKEKGALSFLVIRHGSPDEAKERFLSTAQEVSTLGDFKAVDGLGESARRYVKKTVSGDPMYTVETVKGRFEVQVFNPKITVGGESVGPMCSLDQLEKLIAIQIGRLP